MIRNLLAGAMALALSPPQQTPSVTFTHHAFVESIVCDKGRGTGFRIEDGRWISVNHVTSLGNCKVDGRPIVVTYFDVPGDFSMFIVPGDTRQGGIKVDCRGFRDQEWYYGVGHGLGLPLPMIVTAFYSGVLNAVVSAPHKWSILLYNRFVPGMSGGPVLNRWGWVVGTVNARGIDYNVSFSRALVSTPVCGAAHVSDFGI